MFHKESDFEQKRNDFKSYIHLNYIIEMYNRNDLGHLWSGNNYKDAGTPTVADGCPLSDWHWALIEGVLSRMSC